MLRRRHLPSMAMICPPLKSAKSPAQRLKQILNSWLSITAKTLPNVSCEGMPCSNPNTSVNHASLALPNVSIDTQSSAPQITAHRVMKNISPNLCSFRRLIHKSGIEEKCSMIEAVGCACIKVGQKGSNDRLFQLNVKSVLMRLPWGLNTYRLTTSIQLLYDSRINKFSLIYAKAEGTGSAIPNVKNHILVAWFER